MPLLKAELEHWFAKTGGKPFWIIERESGTIDVYLKDPGDEQATKVER